MGRICPRSWTSAVRATPVMPAAVAQVTTDNHELLKDQRAQQHHNTKREQETGHRAPEAINAESGRRTRIHLGPE